jgi:hypothetical protein
MFPNCETKTFRVLARVALVGLQFRSQHSVFQLNVDKTETMALKDRLGLSKF